MAAFQLGRLAAFFPRILQLRSPLSILRFVQPAPINIALPVKFETFSPLAGIAVAQYPLMARSN
jgi:hypothetical protein